MSKFARFAIALSAIVIFDGAPAVRALADEASERAKIDSEAVADLYKTVGGSKVLAEPCANSRPPIDRFALVAD